MAEDEINYSVVAIGGSAGSLNVILKLIAELPSTLHAIFIIIVHRKNDADSILTDLIADRTKMKVKEVEDKESIQPGTIYIAPADYHLLVEDEKSFSLDSSEKVNYSRPSIDVSFESVADVFGKTAIGILLSGTNADGAQGLRKIKEAGGFTIAQNPQTAEFGFMPQQAINLQAADTVVDATDMADVLNKLPGMAV